MGFSFDAALLQEDDRERLTSSAALLKNPLPHGHYLKDNMFLLGKVARYGNQVIVDINDDTPTMTFDTAVSDAIADRWGKRIPTMVQVKNFEFDPAYTQLTGGSMISLLQGGIEKHVLLQRQIWAKDDPSSGVMVVAAGQYISPTGRCDQPIATTLQAEREEELLVVAKANGTAAFNHIAGRDEKRDVPLVFSFNGQAGLDADLKAHIVGATLRKQGLNANLAPVHALPANLRRDVAGMCTVKTRVNGEVVETCRALPFYEASASMLHFNLPVRVNLPLGLEFTMHNGEAPGRPVRLMTTAEVLAEVERKKAEPDSPGGIFLFNRGAFLGFDNDLPQDLRNTARGGYEGDYANVQRKLAKLPAKERSWTPA